MGRDLLASIQVRDEDIVSNRGPRAVVMLTRLLAAVLLVVLVLQTVTDLLATERLPLRAILGSAGQLAVVAMLLWAISEFAAMLIRSHDDLRATRILMARLVHRVARPAAEARRGDRPESE